MSSLRWDGVCPLICCTRRIFQPLGAPGHPHDGGTHSDPDNQVSPLNARRRAGLTSAPHPPLTDGKISLPSEKACGKGFGPTADAGLRHKIADAPAGRAAPRTGGSIKALWVDVLPTRGAFRGPVTGIPRRSRVIEAGWSGKMQCLRSAVPGSAREGCTRAVRTRSPLSGSSSGARPTGTALAKDRAPLRSA